MNDIRFRIWDKENKKFVPSGMIHLDGTGQQHWLCQDLKWLMPSKDKALDIQFYAGLKDKRKELIYEGDIIKMTELLTAEVVWKDESARFLIRFIQKLWKTKDGKNYRKTVYNSITKASKGEIIGNVHENPEWLEGQGK